MYKSVVGRKAPLQLDTQNCIVQGEKFSRSWLKPHNPRFDREAMGQVCVGVAALNTFRLCP
jgi:hypothetical protein